MVIAYILQTVLGAFFWRTFARENLKQSVIISALVIPNLIALLSLLVVGLLYLLILVEKIVKR